MRDCSVFLFNNNFCPKSMVARLTKSFYPPRILDYYTSLVVVLKVNFEKCRYIIGDSLFREFYTYRDMVVYRNFLMNVEKYLII